MPDYIMLNHGIGSPTGWETYFKTLIDQGKFIGGSAIDHGRSLTQGAWSAAQAGSVTGYIIIRADNFEAAQEIAARSPIHETGGTVDLFEMIETPAPDHP